MDVEKSRKNKRGKPQKIAMLFSESAPIVQLKVSDLSLYLFTTQPSASRSTPL